MTTDNRTAKSWRRIGWRWLALPILVGGVAIGLDWQLGAPKVPAARAAAWGPAGFGPTSYRETIERTQAQLALGRERVRNGPGEWLRQESLARALMRQATLSASYDELAEATAIMHSARRLAPPGTGPLLTDAVLAMTTHRLADCEAALAVLSRAIVLEPGERSEAAALLGDVAFYRGDSAGAARHYTESERLDPAADQSYRRAILAKSAGNFNQAIALFRAAEPAAGKTTPFQHASTALRVGGVEIARGRYDEARRWFERANRQFPGYWLFQAHLGQVKALEGDLPGAIADLRPIAERTRSAEVMDALAIYLREAGRADESRLWSERAAAVWRRRLEQLPQAAYGHAFEHELAFGSPARLLDLARRNLAVRPFGEARVMMAEALLANGRAIEALDQLSLAERSGWLSAPMLALRADALDKLGRASEATAVRARVTALNPRFLEPATVLIRFSHP